MRRQRKDSAKRNTISDRVSALVFNTFDPRLTASNVVTVIVIQALHGRPIELVNISTDRNPICICDIIDEINTIRLEGNAGEVYNIGLSSDKTIGELAWTVMDMVELKIRVKIVDDRSPDDEMKIEGHIPNTTKLTKFVGTPNYAFDE